MRSWRLAAIAPVVLLNAIALAASQAEMAPVRVGGTIPPPQKIKDVRPVYPPEAQAARVQGVVVIEATIDPAGKISRALVLRSIPELDQAAIDAVRQWEYTPTLLNGVAVPVIMTVTVNFAMQGAPPPSAAPLPAPPQSSIRLTAFNQKVWEITLERARQQPRWDPANGSVSLSTADAIRIAKEWQRQQTPEGQPSDVQAVSLSRRRQMPDIDFWFYQVNLFPYGARAMSPVVILPDGSVVEPQAGPAVGPAAAAPTTPVTPLPPGVFRPGPTVTPPRLLSDVRPHYTEAAMRKHIAGTVLVECIVLPDGTVGEVRLIRSLDAVYGLDEAAIDAARQYRFAPGMRDGQPVPVAVTVELTFTLR